MARTTKGSILLTEVVEDFKNLSITIKGRSNTGKSTIAYAIFQILRENGFDVEIKDDDYNIYDIQGMNIDKAIEAVKKNTIIKIETAQVYQSYNGDIEFSFPLIGR